MSGFSPTGTPTVAVVVCVFNALAAVRECLHALNDASCAVPFTVTVINDGSDAATSDWLRAHASAHPDIQLIEHATNWGYTASANEGLERARADYVVLLNSDTVVTAGWLDGLLRCAESHPRPAIVGPLSNAASWQSIPRSVNALGEQVVNAWPKAMSPDEMAALVKTASGGIQPLVPLVNGFCMMIRRELLSRIGFFDVERFPVGYGEEDDLCLRAISAGYSCAIATDVFVLHRKSASFGTERRSALVRAGQAALRSRHGKDFVDRQVETVAKNADLRLVRERIANALSLRWAAVSASQSQPLRIVFALPFFTPGGGVHSVVQEAWEMRRLGHPVRVLIEPDDYPSFLHAYRSIPGIGSLFLVRDASFDEQARCIDILIATHNKTVAWVRKVVARHPDILPAYYVQDYEPLFNERGSTPWLEAMASYTEISGSCLFAKTDWIGQTVHHHHGVRVAKVEPSLDHALFRPCPRRTRDGMVSVVAMIRPQTPYRGAARTMRVLATLARNMGRRLHIEIFGCESGADEFRMLQQDFPHRNHGVLDRPEVARILARADVFVDLSDYQAFGRTALEAMACGCAVVLTKHGGVSEFATDGQNAVLVDPNDEADCLRQIDALIHDPERLGEMRQAGIETAARYSIHSAAVSTLSVLRDAWAGHRERTDLSLRPVSALPMPGLSGAPAAEGAAVIELAAAAWSGNTANTAIFRHHGLLSLQGLQFTAFYLDPRHLRVVRRNLSTQAIDHCDIPGDFGILDAHHCISVGHDRRGHLHLLYDCHASRVRYRRSIRPFDISGWTDEGPLSGRNEGRFTYPTFLLPAGDNVPLRLLYRDGVAGKGTARLKAYVEAQNGWVDAPSPLLDGATLFPWTSSPYWFRPVTGRDGRLHLAYVWRLPGGPASPVINIGIDHAVSRDHGRSWETIGGHPLALPITPVNTERVHPIPAGRHLINQCGMAVDRRGRPHVALLADDGTGIPQYQHLWHDGQTWRHGVLGLRQSPFGLHGGGTLRLPTSRPEVVIDPLDRVYLIARGDFSGNRLAAIRLLPPDYCPDDATVRILYPEDLGHAEPVIDHTRWQREGVLSLLVQYNDQPDHDVGVTQQTAPIRILDIPLIQEWHDMDSSKNH